MTEDRQAIAAEMWVSGASMTQIADRIGSNRSVAGRIMRLKSRWRFASGTPSPQNQRARASPPVGAAQSKLAWRRTPPVVRHDPLTQRRPAGGSQIVRRSGGDDRPWAREPEVALTQSRSSACPSGNWRLVCAGSP